MNPTEKLSELTAAHTQVYDAVSDQSRIQKISIVLMLLTMSLNNVIYMIYITSTNQNIHLTL